MSEVAATTSTPEVVKPESAKPVDEEKKVEVPLFFQRVHIQNKFTHGKITLREFSNIESINGSVLLQGFPNATSDNVVTSMISCSYLVEHLKLPLVGDLVSLSFPPMTIVKGGIPAPGARIYGNKNICIFASEYTIKDAEIQHNLVQATVEFAERHKCCMILCLDAVSGDPSESTSLLEQIHLSAEEGAEMAENDDGLDEDDEDHDVYDSPRGRYSRVLANQASSEPVGFTAPSNELGVRTLGDAVRIPNTSAAHSSNKDDKKKNKKDSVKLSEKDELKKKKKDDDQKKKKDDNKKDDDKKKKKDDDQKRKKKLDDDSDDEDHVEAEDSDIWFVTNNQSFGEVLETFHMEPCVELALSGVQGGLVNEARFIDTPVVLLLASLDKLSLGARPALGLLQAVEKFISKVGCTSLGLDMSNLEESTTSLEAKINEVMKKMQQGPPKEESKMNMLYL